MKKLLFVILLLPSICFANPFFMSDQSPDGATHYRVEIDGVLDIAYYAGDTVMYDLEGVSPGEHPEGAQEKPAYRDRNQGRRGGTLL